VGKKINDKKNRRVALEAKNSIWKQKTSEATDEQ
jgi:hypothetical protein